MASAACLALPIVAFGQSAKDSSVYARAQQMVANGDAVNGRKLVDSVAAAAPAGTPAFAEGLFWRATVASNARDSEHEYRQIIVDYPLSGRVPDALLRIGQLEAARGENAAALQHFQRLVLEHPASPLRAEASYWVARMYFDANDATKACTANGDALTNVKSSNVELKNRIDFQQQRCRGVALASNAASSAASSAAAAPPPATTAKPVVEQKAAKKPEPRVEEKPESKIEQAPAASGATGVVTRQPTKEEVDRALASATRPVLRKSPKGAVSSTKREASAPAESAATTHTGRSYAIQVAAFGTKAPANQLAEKLRGRGYISFVDGEKAPYRVRLGRYPTQAAATLELAKLKARHIDGFVVER